MSQREQLIAQVNSPVPLPTRKATGSSALPAPPPEPPARLWIALIVLTGLSDPLTWGAGFSSPWFMPAGFAFAFVAWFGPRAALAVLLGRAVAVWVAWMRGSFLGPAAITLAWCDTPLIAIEAWLAWELYRRGRGARGLADPRSAILFLLLVPGAVAVLFAMVRAGLYVAMTVRPGVDFTMLLAEFWLGRALALASLVPPLLVGATSALVRRQLTPIEVVDESLGAQRGSVFSALRFGDWLEILALALGAGVLSLLLCLGPGAKTPDAWQLWGPPMLLIFWASIRQGMLGGTLAAAAATVLPLLALTGEGTSKPLLLLEANLLAECAAALLVTASSTWIRLSEARYRQVVGHVPVVLYSARMVANATSARTPKAEVTLVSAACESLLACSPEALLGDYDRWLQRVHPKDRELLVAAVNQLTLQQQPVSCEYRLLTPDSPDDAEVTKSRSGAFPSSSVKVIERWVRDTLAPQFDSAGVLIGWEGVVVDVSQQRALADDLRRTTTMFHTLIDNLPAGVVFVQGASGRPVLVNSRARQLLGRRDEVSAGVDHFPAVYRLQRLDGTPYPAEELPVVQALRLGKSASCDDIVVHRIDGRRVPLITWAAPVELGGHGRDAAAVWVIEDVTALHQAEAARRDSEGRLRAVIEAMAGGLVVLDRRGMVLDCNPTACELLGESAERLRGHLLDDYPRTCLREDGSLLQTENRPWHAVLKNGRPVRNLLLGLAPATPARVGESPVVHWILVNAMPLAMGTPNGGAVMTFTDVTAFRKAQEGIRLSEERYRTLVESMPFMLIQVDGTGRVTYANPATHELSGYSMEEIVEPTLWEALILPEYLPRVREMLAEALAGQGNRGELRYRDKRGKERVAYSINRPIWVDGKAVGATALLLDVTRERHLELELERARRLELIGRLASGVAHDFNNLLSVVLGVSELAGVALPADHPVHDDLRRITAAGEQASNLAGQLLAFAKQQKVERRRVDVNVVANRALDLLRVAVRPNIKVEAELGVGELIIEADETQLQQVLMNLCLNARDAMPRGGLIRVQTTTQSKDGDWVRLTVQDEGEGMTEQVKRQLFDAFFTTKDNGTGLGLAVVQQIVEGFNGRIEVSSEPGRGARFDVWLPRLMG